MGTKESSPKITAIPLRDGETATLKRAAAIACVSPETIRRWAIKYGIGKQLDPGATWHISTPALRMVAACDSEALEAFRAGERTSPLVAGYVSAARSDREYSR